MATTPVLTLRRPGFDTDGGADVEAFGSSVASAGDVNGDGYGDVIVADLWTERAYVYPGSASGLSNTPVTLRPPGDAEGGAGVGSFGSSVASAGDVNGDGYADVIVGAAGSSDGGRAFVYHGGASGPPSTPAMTLRPPSGVDGGAPVGGFGVAVASAGDVNADGYADVVIGASGRPSSGRAYIYHGSTSGLSKAPSATLQGDGGSGADDFGNSVACGGDVNGDGYTDVIIGAFSAGRGRAFVYLGRAAGLSNTPVVTLQPPDIDSGATGDNFGNSVANAGDVNGDGYGDVVVGAWYANGGAGRAYVFFGESLGLSASTGVLLQRSGGTADDQFGVSVAGAGDINHDGYTDIVVGAWRANHTAGRAYIYLGDTGSPRLFPPVTLDRPNEDGDGGAGPILFGGSVARLERVDGNESQPRLTRFRGRGFFRVERLRAPDTCDG